MSVIHSFLLAIGTGEHYLYNVKRILWQVTSDNWFIFITEKQEAQDNNMQDYHKKNYKISRNKLKPGIKHTFKRNETEL